MARLIALGAAAAIVLTMVAAGRVTDSPARIHPAAVHHHAAGIRDAAVQRPPRTRRPDTVVIPVLGVRAPLVATAAVGAPGSATLTIPRDIHTVAWWDGGYSNGVRGQAPRPGQPGVALIAGHVDSAAAGPGALYSLARLKAGNLVRVTLHGRTTAWRVMAAPQLTPKTALPRALFRTGGPPRLALVTCGGGFDAATGHYLDNVIVWAAPAERA